jgi:hypothetical protein
MAANWPRSHARELDRGRPINTPTAGHCPREAGMGNASQYQASVFNFARTWESIYLNFDLDAHAVPAVPGALKRAP